MALIWTPATAPSGRRMYEAQDPRFAAPARCMAIGAHWEAFGSVAAACADGSPGVVLIREAGATAAIAQAAFASRFVAIVLQHGLA